MSDAVQQDLDLFLTSIESKLRGPFSSLDLAKAVSTSALRDNLSETDYLDRIRQVIHKTDKITQMRILIGLLGLDPSPATDAVIKDILTKSESAYEEWVRIIASLVAGIMFDDADGRPMIGDEAKKLLDKTCADIIKRVEKLERESNFDDMDVDASRLDKADADPLMAPYRYALLNPPLLESIMPETTSHAHFAVNSSAQILQMDARLERAKAEEEKEHAAKVGLAAPRPGPSTSTGSKESSVSSATAAPVFPGFRPMQPTKSTVPQRPKASMFLPTRKPGQKPVVKTSLHTRKAGAAQALLNKGRRNRLPVDAAGGGVRGRALGANRSKMMMIDVKEVQDLSGKRDETSKTEPSKGVKRKAPTEATAKVSKPKTTPPPKTGPTEAAPNKTSDSAGALASAALSAYQAQLKNQEPAPVPAPAPAPEAAKQQDWRSMLKSKSNRLSADDRFRIQQFFVDRFNPTPDQPVVKLKLHEERSNDPKSGAPVKETYYLELDYNTFTSKQSKKTKRYTKD